MYTLKYKGNWIILKLVQNISILWRFKMVLFTLFEEPFLERCFQEFCPKAVEELQRWLGEREECRVQLEKTGRKKQRLWLLLTCRTVTDPQAAEATPLFQMTVCCGTAWPQCFDLALSRLTPPALLQCHSAPPSSAAPTYPAQNTAFPLSSD